MILLSSKQQAEKQQEDSLLSQNLNNANFGVCPPDASNLRHDSSDILADSKTATWVTQELIADLI